MRNLKKYSEFLNENRTEDSKILMMEEKVKEWNEIHPISNKQINEILKEANILFKGYGVEPITDENAFVDKYYYNIIGLYVNMGDTYDTTIVYDTEHKEFLVTSWGNFYEEWMKENPNESDVQ